jgi:3-oxoacyl-[acyl-carrier protein] reductase
LSDQPAAAPPFDRGLAEGSLAGRVALVTGGSRGIGRSIAEALASKGAAVGIMFHEREAPAREFEAAVRTKGGRSWAGQCDIADPASVTAFFEQAAAALGPADILVNNAGIVRDAQLVKWKDGAVQALMTDDAFDAVVGVNLRGVFHCARAVAPHMIRQGSGVILNASSVVGLYGNFGQTNYAATKAAVINLTRTWSRELGRYGIRVNAVAPGFVATEILRAMPQKVLDSMVGHTPLGRMGEPRDIADAYAWLASDQASFVHGSTISVDGGLVVGT